MEMGQQGRMEEVERDLSGSSILLKRGARMRNGVALNPGGRPLGETGKTFL